MTRRPDESAAVIERYLDGLLAGEELRMFEDSVRGDRRLRVEIEAQRRIDTALRRMFAAPTATLNGAALAHGSAHPGAASSPRANKRWTGRISGRVLGVSLAAAVVAVAGVSAWFWIPRPQPHPLAEWYAREVAAGFIPAEKCTDEAQFIAWTARALGTGIRAASLPAGVELLGWNYRRIDGLPAYILLARADGRDVEVFMVRNLSLEQAPAERTYGPVRVFRRQLGRVCLFEVTPLERPVLLNALELAPEPSPAPEPPGANGQG